MPADAGDSAVEDGRLPFLERLGLHRPELRAWAMYDWAITGFWAVVVAAVFPVYFATVAADELPRDVVTQYFGIATALGIAVIAVVAPVIGAVTDYRPWKKRLLGAFAGLGIASAAALFFVQQGDWLFGLTVFVLVNWGANGSTVFYDALLPHLASPKEVDRVSSAGFAVGYFGAGLLLLFVLLMIQRPDWFGLPPGTLPPRLAFLAVALWWLVFSIPLFLRVPEPRPRIRPDAGGRVGLVRQAAGDVVGTLRELRAFRHAFLMLVAFLIYNDGIGTIIRMAGIYGDEIGIAPAAIYGAIVMVQFVGVPFSFLFGMLAGRIGAKRGVFIGLAVYMLISVTGYFITTAAHFFMLAFMVGMVQGGTQALSRSLFASMIPRYKSGEFFGFFAVVEKFSGMVGPLVFGFAAAATGSSRYGILSVIAFFAVGGILLYFVDVPEGRSVAREEERRIEELEASGAAAEH